MLGGDTVNLLQGERVLMESSGKLLTLTSHRVRYETKQAGRSKVISITLDAVASCGLVTRSYPALLGLAVLAVLAGVFSLSRSSDGALLLFIGAAILVVVYLVTRSAMIEVASSAGRVLVRARGMSHESLMEFIDQVDAAKLAFLRSRAAEPVASAA